MKGNGLSDVWRIANEITAILQQWLSLHEWNEQERRYVKLDAPVNRPPLRFNKTDQARLLKLRVWSIRYYVSIPSILTLIMSIMRAQVHFRRGNKPAYGLGLSVRALVGPSAERILQEELAKHYPLQENKMAWKENARAEQLECEKLEELEGLQPKGTNIKPLLGYPTVESFVDSYKENMLKRRSDNRTRSGQKWRKKKNYRWNPWL